MSVKLLHVALRHSVIICSSQQVLSVAARFAVSVDDILFWNPDIASNVSRYTPRLFVHTQANAANDEYELLIMLSRF